MQKCDVFCLTKNKCTGSQNLLFVFCGIKNTCSALHLFFLKKKQMQSKAVDLSKIQCTAVREDVLVGFVLY